MVESPPPPFSVSLPEDALALFMRLQNQDESGNRMRNQAFFVSLVLILRPLYPHFLHRAALMAFLALQFMQIFLTRFLASASGNLAMLDPLAPPTGLPYITLMGSLWTCRRSIQERVPPYFSFLPSSARCASKASSCILSLAPAIILNSASPIRSTRRTLASSLTGRSKTVR